MNYGPKLWGQTPAIKTALAVNYEGVTVNFWWTNMGIFISAEMNTRIQVEHPIAEE